MRGGTQSDMSERETKSGAERREHARFDTELSVDYGSGETFLFSYISNISEMGIFIRSEDPLAVGTSLELRFGPKGEEPLSIAGEVVWVNPVRADGENLNPGMGIRFRDLSSEMRERVVGLVRSIAYINHPNDHG